MQSHRWQPTRLTHPWDFPGKNSGVGFHFLLQGIKWKEKVKPERWVLKNWWFWTVVLEKTLESPLDCREIQPVHPNEDRSWVFIGRTDVEAETPILWPPDAKSWLIWKDPGVGKDWGQEEKEMTGWDGWMASLTQWTWVWVNSGSWWWTGIPLLLWSMGLQSRTRMGDWTELSICGEKLKLWYKTEPLQSLSWNLTVAPASVPAALLLPCPHTTASKCSLSYLCTTSVHLECPFLLSPQGIPSCLPDPVKCPLWSLSFFF